MKIFIDSDYKCHVSNDGTMREFEVPDFDGMCPAFIEGYRYVPPGEAWTRSDGKVFKGKMRSPWRDKCLLDEFQAQYEAQQAEAEAIKAENDIMKEALAELGVTEDD